MKRTMNLILLVLMVVCGIQAQAQSDSAQNKIYVVTKNDGTVFIGKILSQDAREVLMDTKKIGQVVIPKHEIKSIEEAKSESFNEQGEYIPSEVFSTRYFITTNGLPIEKGESYVQWNLFGPDFQFGVRKNFGLGIMTSWIGMPVIGSAKYSIKLGKKTNLGLGTLVGTGSWAAPDFGLALPFAAITYGDRRTNINLSAGYGALFYEGNTDGRFLISAAGMTKIGKKISLVFDSFIMPPGAYYTAQVESMDINGQLIVSNVNKRRDGFALLIPGIRWQMESNKAFQFGFGGLMINDDLVPVPIPLVQWYRKL